MKKITLFGREMRCLSNTLFHLGLPQRSMKQIVARSGSLDDFIRQSFQGKTEEEVLAIYDKNVELYEIRSKGNTPEDYAELCAALKEIVGEAMGRYDGKTRELLEELHCDNPPLAARRIVGRYYATQKRKRERQFR